MSCGPTSPHRAAPAVLAGVLGALLVLGAASVRAQDAGQPSPSPQEALRSVSLQPRGATPGDPHGGAWFVLTLEPGETETAEASLVNPNDQPVKVSLALRDLVFGDDGTPRVDDEAPDTGVGAWGRFNRTEIEVPAHQTRAVDFQITVPSGAAPRDHFGVAVAETRHVGAEAEVVQRVATRVIVTVPGEADRAFEITRVTVERTSAVVPSSVVVRVTLRNTGSIRLNPQVLVADQTAAGSRLLTARSAEEYVAEVPVSPLGGWVRLPVVATDESGLTRRVDEAATLVPWWLLGLLAVGAGVGVALVGWGRRHSRVANLAADVARLERLVMDVRQRVETADLSLDGDREARRNFVLESALKRARRSEQHNAFAQFALALHEESGDALPPLLEALTLETGARDRLLDAVATYEPGRVAEAAMMAGVDEQVLGDVAARRGR